MTLPVARDPGHDTVGLGRRGRTRTQARRAA